MEGSPPAYQDADAQSVAFRLRCVSRSPCSPAFQRANPRPAQLTLREVNDTVAQALSSATPPPAFSTRVYQAIRPSLVLIKSNILGVHGQVEDTLGSGVVINTRGDILTSLYVVEDATRIEVIFADGTQSLAEVTFEQTEDDIAILSASQAPALVIPATLGNPNAMQFGDEAFAFGNPFGLYGSLSAGVISGFDRSFWD